MPAAERRSGPAAGPQQSIPDSFWRDLRAAPTALLALDYDGTLAPFREQRDAAVPYPGVVELLARIRDEARTRLLVISGRPPAEAAGLLGLEPAPEVYGGHGWEHLAGDGSLTRRSVPEAAAAALAAAERDALAAGWSARLERKHASVALHWRGAGDPQDAACRARSLLAPHAQGADLALLEFAAGLELRCGRWDKGRALSAVLADLAAGDVAAYLGDDRTDEDAFAVLAARPRGMPVLVAAEARDTAASARLVPPEELLAFLERWLETRKEKPS